LEYYDKSKGVGSQLNEVEDRSFGDLIKEVVEPGHCTVCGTCVAVCPYHALTLRGESFRRLDLDELEVTRNTYKSIEDLCQRCGFCYYNCPELWFNLEKAEGKAFGAVAKDELGHFREAVMAQATDRRILDNAQCGGAATALLKYMLEYELVDAAVTVASTERTGWKPQPTVIVNSRDLLKTQKTKYTPAATVMGVKSALYEWVRSRVAFVATPCQVRGIWTADTSPKGYTRMLNSTELIIGSFCYGTYPYNDLFRKLLVGKHKIYPSSISKIDLDTEKMRVYANSELKLEIHRSQLRRFLRKSCENCHDFTNRLADVSVGGVGSPEKWTTVLIRTERGKRIFEDAEKEGYLRTESLPDQALEDVRSLARLKHEEGATS